MQKRTEVISAGGTSSERAGGGGDQSDDFKSAEEAPRLIQKLRGKKYNEK